MTTATTTDRINVTQLHGLMQDGDTIEIIDVRTPAEYQAVHATGVRNVPLNRLKPQDVMNSRSGPADAPLYVICKSGGRSGQACTMFRSAGYDNVVNVDGGTDAWVAAGLPVERGQVTVIPLDRQMQMLVGSLVLFGVLLSVMVNPAWIWLAGFMGFGLIFAGITGKCPMAALMAHMPWNRG